MLLPIVRLFSNWTFTTSAMCKMLILFCSISSFCKTFLLLPKLGTLEFEFKASSPRSPFPPKLFELLLPLTTIWAVSASQAANFTQPVWRTNMPSLYLDGQKIKIITRKGGALLGFSRRVSLVGIISNNAFCPPFNISHILQQGRNFPPHIWSGWRRQTNFPDFPSIPAT